LGIFLSISPLDKLCKYKTEAKSHAISNYKNLRGHLPKCLISLLTKKHYKLAKTVQFKLISKAQFLANLNKNLDGNFMGQIGNYK
jgi:hypothetical protein